MYAIGLTKGLVVGAAGGALVLAGFAGSGPSSSSAADLVATAPQGAVEDGKPDRSIPVNIYRTGDGTMKGDGIEGTGQVTGGWIQGTGGEIHVADGHGDHNWTLRQVALTTDTLRMIITDGTLRLTGTLSGFEDDDRTTYYDGTLDDNKGHHVRFAGLRVKSEFRGYDIRPGGNVKVSINNMTIVSGCVFRAKGNFVGSSRFGTKNVNLTLNRGGITPNEITFEMTINGQPIEEIKVPGQVHVYNGSGRTSTFRRWTITDMTLVKRDTVSECATL